eukprot:7130364-Prymnesium_polylepis.1
MSTTQSSTEPTVVVSPQTRASNRYLTERYAAALVLFASSFSVTPTRYPCWRHGATKSDSE